MAAPLTVSIEGLSRVDKFLARHVPAVRDAYKTALEKSGTAAADETRAEMLRVKDIRQVKLLNKRIQSFLNTEKKKNPFARVWVGLKPIYAKEAPFEVERHTANKLFWATLRSGHTGLFTRREPGVRRTKHGYRYASKKTGELKWFKRPATSSANLPIDEPQIRLTPEVEGVLIEQTRKAVEREFVPTFRKNFKLL